MPVLKIDPSSGESLDKAKTPEQILAEQAKEEKFYNERKRRFKNKGKQKKIIKEDIQVTVNPFTSKNSDPSPEELIKGFDKLLHECEGFIKTVTKSYKLTKPTKDDKGYELTLKRPKAPLKVTYESDFTINEHIPTAIEYNEINITSIPLETDIFTLDPVKKKASKRNIVVERIMFNTLDVKLMLKHPETTKKLLLDLTKKVLATIVSIKYLKPMNKYYGTTVASLKIPGTDKSYCLNFKDEYIEIRVWSDIAEVL